MPQLLDQVPDEINNAFSSSTVRALTLLSIWAGAVITIAGGFVVTYKALVLLGTM